MFQGRHIQVPHDPVQGAPVEVLTILIYIFLVFLLEFTVCAPFTFEIRRMEPAFVDPASEKCARMVSAFFFVKNVSFCQIKNCSLVSQKS